MMQFQNESSSFEFYEQRYRKGYMDDWPEEKLKRIFSVVRALKLPDTGKALDSGCGNGMFTAILKLALPAGWQVYGVDISPTAIGNARISNPDCIFFDLGDDDFKNMKFDFAFTHHVLEHVYDLNRTMAEIESHLNEQSCVLHVLPCGNKGSFESELCSLRRDGINPEMGNRFFFEDEGHVRRLTTDELVVLMAENGFALSAERYSCQYYGAIDWITNSGIRFLLNFTNPDFGIDKAAQRKLWKSRLQMLPFTILRHYVHRAKIALRIKPADFRSRLRFLFYSLIYFLTRPFDLAITRLSENEWNRKQHERNGSEMYLFFKRDTQSAREAKIQK